MKSLLTDTTKCKNATNFTILILIWKKVSTTTFVFLFFLSSGFSQSHNKVIEILAGGSIQYGFNVHSTAFSVHAGLDLLNVARLKLGAGKYLKTFTNSSSGKLEAFYTCYDAKFQYLLALDNQGSLYASVGYSNLIQDLNYPSGKTESNSYQGMPIGLGFQYRINQVAFTADYHYVVSSFSRHLFNGGVLIFLSKN
jgi:hypothetical protein